MKFLSWILNFRSRHLNEIIRYDKSKTWSKVFTIILMLVLAGGSFAVEYWTFSLFNTEILKGLIVFLLLLLPLLLVTFETCALYTYLGFKTFALGTLETIIVKIESKKKKKTNQNPIDMSSQDPQTKSHKAIDLFVGIFGLIIGIGSLILIAVIAFNTISDTQIK